MADDSIATMRAGCLSLVLALAIALSAVYLDASGHDLDGQHLSRLLCLALAYTGTAMDRTWLGHDPGIRLGGRGRCDRGGLSVLKAA